MKYNEKKLLILGANPETAGLVKRANELGIRTYVTDYDPNAYAKRYATNPCNIDASDVENLIKLVNEECIDGVMVGVAERLLPFYYQLCNRLNMPCYGNMDLFSVFTDKKRFKDTCKMYQVPVVPEYEVRNNRLDSINFPVIVKPVDSCSSKGISVCKSQHEFSDGIGKALSFSSSKNVLVEKYMTGEEIVIYYVIQDGEPACVAVCDRYTNKEQYGVAQLPTSYIFPSKYTGIYLDKIDENVKKMLKGIGVKNGPLFIQAFVQEGDIYFYEPGFRLNGAQEHYIVNELMGIDVKDCLIHFAFTGKMSEETVTRKANPLYKKYACKLSPLVRTGKITQLNGIKEIGNLPGVISVNPSYREGDTVDGYGTLKQIVCRFYIVSDTKEELKETIDKIMELLEVKGNDGQSMLLKPFDSRVVLNY